MWLSGKGNISTFYRQGVMLYSSWAKKIPQDKLPQKFAFEERAEHKTSLIQGLPHWFFLFSLGDSE